MTNTPEPDRDAPSARVSLIFKAYGILAMLVAISARTVSGALDLPPWVPRAVVLGAFASLPIVFAGLWLWARHSQRDVPPHRR
jgi:hypothetical protein